MSDFKGVPIPVSLRDRESAAYEDFWWREGVLAAVRHIKPQPTEVTEEELDAAVALVTTLLLTYSVDGDPDAADLLAREIVRGLTQDDRL